MSTTASAENNDFTTSIVIVSVMLLVLVLISVYSIWSYNKGDILQNSISISPTTNQTMTKDEAMEVQQLVKSHKVKRHKRHR